jgi:23S rRNA-/tRNA-specific pseudouridylate synthase
MENIETNTKHESIHKTNNSNNINNSNKIIKPKKKIKSEYSEMKPNIIRAHNLRFIEPYEFKYQLYAKGRWVGKKLIDVLLNEFRQYDRNYFLSALKNQNLQINQAQVEEDYIIQRTDFITHVTIRKENPIIDVKLDIIHDDENFLAIDKPSSWPTHVCGGYFFNTMHRILTDEYGYKDLKILHRLDKHTSGVVIMAKNKIAAEKFCKKISVDSVEKNYFCRVRGDFPHDKINVIRSIIYVNKAKGIYTDVDDDSGKDLNANENQVVKEKIYYTTDCEVEVDVMRKISNNKKSNSSNKYDKSGVLIHKEEDDGDEDDKNTPKYAETFFKKVFYDEKSNTSLVLAKPKTGRTHQIRIHLRYLGYPIANDPCYGGIIYNDLKELMEYNTKGKINPDLLKFQQFIPEEKEIIVNEEIPSEENEYTNTVHDSNKNESISVSEMYCYKIWLHSWKYKFDKYEFTTKIPEWAEDNYKIDHKF